MTLPKRVRFHVLRRCNFSCFYCGLQAPTVGLHIDHVVPRAMGGTDDPWNLVAACQPCNLGKADGAPTQEMVERARALFRDYGDAFGLHVGTCSVCTAPIAEGEIDEGDEYMDQCEPCNAAISDAYRAGYLAAMG